MAVSAAGNKAKLKPGIKEGRYARQAKLKELSETGNFQAKLGKKTAAIIGLGGIGSLSAELLARAGVGNIILVDNGRVELTNLHRQVLYREGDIGKNKALLAMQKLKKINSEICINAIDLELNSSNIKKYLGRPDLILDCTDNLKTRLAINEYCIKIGTPWIFASALGTKGMICSLFGDSLSFNWFSKEFGKKKGFSDVNSEGILNTACNAVACIQATEAIKILCRKKKKSELIHFDIWKNELEIIRI